MIVTNLHALGFKYENVWVKIGKTKNWESKKQTLLDIEIDRILSFDDVKCWHMFFLLSATEI